jgi:hypothetical protein
MVDDSKELLNKYVNDVFVYKDHYKGNIYLDIFYLLFTYFPLISYFNLLDNESGPSSGYGLTLVAESTTDCMISVEMMAPKGVLPEELSTLCSKGLLSEMMRGIISLHK